MECVGKRPQLHSRLNTDLDLYVFYPTKAKHWRHSPGLCQALFKIAFRKGKKCDMLGDLLDMGKYNLHFTSVNVYIKPVEYTEEI